MFRPLAKYAALIFMVAVVAVAVSGCSDRERFNCIRVNNERVTTPTNVEVGTGRCA
jgi:hypothetical protein